MGPGTGELPNRTPVTCCTIWRKLAGSAVMKVVGDRFDARDLRFEIFPVAAGAVFRRFVAISGSDPEPVGVGTVSGLMRLKIEAAELVSPATVSVSESLERDFCRALVRVSVSRRKASETHESVKVRKVHGSRLAKLSEDAIFSYSLYLSRLVAIRVQFQAETEMTEIKNFSLHSSVTWTKFTRKSTNLLIMAGS
uniref:Uncharacterized protein n=1 Tax=Nelumbo nucifera TaxID=4432 RepID=A0A822ZJ39_NELNU|nr:TPA_asm: hypothetical protein HUJ06_001266 [Nelumbo nucifera]